MTKVKHEILASGTVINADNLKVLATISKVTKQGIPSESASNAAEESGTTSDLHVVVKMKSDDFGDTPAAPISFEDIVKAVEAAGGEMIVPVLGSDKETLYVPEPVMITYAKTKSFKRMGKDGMKECIRAEIRFIA